MSATSARSGRGTYRQHLPLRRPRSRHRGATVRSASVPSKETRLMNNLHRELAPISDAAWAQIEEETSRTLKRYLAGRRVVDVQGPGGIALSAVGTGHLRNIDGAGRRHPRPPARGEGAGRVARSLRARSPADRRRRARRQRLGLAAGEGRRAADRLCRGPGRSSRATPPPASAASAREPAIR